MTKNSHILTPDLVILGIGNPGPQYANTRHNVGFWFIDQIAEQEGIELKRQKNLVRTSRIQLDNRSIILAKSRTFVNVSGDAAEYLITRYQIELSQLLVVYDDIHLPVSRMRLRAQGSAGGHNGIRSIIAAVHSQDFPRIRIGVGSPESGVDQVGYVLGTPDSNEKESIDQAISKAVASVRVILNEGINIAMNKFN
tara:strand:+ start:67 stop:654 length:588 start_codon:yes stop_codon:yes gene_type:complete